MITPIGEGQSNGPEVQRIAGYGIELVELHEEIYEEFARVVADNRAHISQFFSPIGRSFDTVEKVREEVARLEKGKKIYAIYAPDEDGRPAICGGYTVWPEDVDEKGDSTHTTISYWRSAEAGGKGVMSRAVNAYADHYFSDPRHESLYAVVALNNQRSARVLAETGFCVVIEDEKKLIFRRNRPDVETKALVAAGVVSLAEGQTS